MFLLNCSEQFNKNIAVLIKEKKCKWEKFEIYIILYFYKPFLVYF